MIEHVVLFRLKDGSSESNKTQLIEGLRSLSDKVPSIQYLSAGLNFSSRSDGYEIGLVVRFVDEAGLAAYQNHPEHVRVVQELVRPHAEKVLAVDYFI